MQNVSVNNDFGRGVLCGLEFDRLVLTWRHAAFWCGVPCVTRAIVGPILAAEAFHPFVPIGWEVALFVVLDPQFAEPPAEGHQPAVLDTHLHADVRWEVLRTRHIPVLRDDWEVALRGVSVHPSDIPVTRWRCRWR